MKRSLSLLLILSLLCALLAGCAGTACPPASGGGDQEPLPKTEGAVARCRVVAVGEGNTLLLADVDSERGDIYTLDAGSVSLYREPTERGELLADSQLAAGALVEVAFGGDILESYPALFGGVERITVLPDEFDDRCALYLRVLGDLWGKDTGLNGGAEIVSVDLSKAPGGLTAGEKAAVAYVFAQKHGVQGLTMTFDELREEGYLMGEKLEGGSTAYSFTNGLLFTITPEETQDNGASVCFSAGKWRSPLGAYYFTKCTASRGESGWEYSVGAEMIS